MRAPDRRSAACPLRTSGVRSRRRCSGARMPLAPRKPTSRVRGRQWLSGGSIRCDGRRIPWSSCLSSMPLVGVARRDAPGVSRRPTAAQQGPAVSRRPADGGGDRRRDAPDHRRSPRLAVARADRRALARRAANPGGARACRARPGPPARVAGRAQRQRRPAPRDRHGRLGWERLSPWLDARVELPIGPLFCIIDGPTRGHAWSSAGVRVELRRRAMQANVRRRFARHQLRHAHAV
jgi:hypothetical protein